MLEFIKLKLRALLPEDWAGKAGDKFRKTGKLLSDFNRDHVQLEDKAKGLPTLGWNRLQGEANEKYTISLKNFEAVEATKIANEIARRTAEDKVREAKASADKMQAEARISEANEWKARLDFVERCKDLNVFPVWNESGDMKFVKAPENTDWSALIQKLMVDEMPQDRSADAKDKGRLNP